MPTLFFTNTPPPVGHSRVLGCGPVELVVHALHGRQSLHAARRGKRSAEHQRTRAVAGGVRGGCCFIAHFTNCAWSVPWGPRQVPLAVSMHSGWVVFRVVEAAPHRQAGRHRRPHAGPGCRMCVHDTQTAPPGRCMFLCHVSHVQWGGGEVWQPRARTRRCDCRHEAR